MRTETELINQRGQLALLKAEQHPVTHAIVSSAIDSTAKGEDVARRRLQNPEPYMNRTKKLWKATVAEYVRGEDGAERRQRREITLGPTASMSKREAQRRLRPILDRVNASAFNPTPKQKNIAFDAFTDVWDKDYLSQSKPSTRATMWGHVKKLKQFFGQKEIRGIDTGDVQRFVVYLTAQGYKPKTIRNFWITLRLILNAAVTQEYADNIPHKPKLPRAFRQKPRCFTTEEVAKILRATKDEELYLLYWLAAETGLRAGEIEGLRPHDVVLRGITVRQTIWNGIAGDPKTPNALRTIATSGFVEKWLSVWASERLEAGGQRLFPHGTDWYRKNCLQPLLKQLGIQPAGFHAFRHFNASVMDRLRIPLKTRQVRLGHASTGSLTLDVYTHAEWDENVEAAFQISETIWDAIRYVSLSADEEKGLAGGVQQALTVQQETGCGGQI
jgi:integrase